jgi:transposase
VAGVRKPPRKARERQLLARHKTNPVSQRLASIPGIGPIIATAIATTVAARKRAAIFSIV